MNYLQGFQCVQFVTLLHERAVLHTLGKKLIKSVKGMYFKILFTWNRMRTYLIEAVLIEALSAMRI